MKKLFLLFGIFIWFTPLADAQSKQKSTDRFVKELNHILKATSLQHWNYSGTMSVDSAFAVNDAGILSVTVRYTQEDSSFIRTRMEAPVSKIINIAYDLYLILEYKEEEVIIYDTEAGSNTLKESSRFHLFHIGEPAGDGYREREKLEKLLNNMLPYYKK